MEKIEEIYMSLQMSLITVCFNSEKTIQQTIESVLAQDNNNIEYIIIDGGSSDKTVDIIKTYESKIAYWVSEPDLGLYDAMNKGIDKANGDIIGIINSDDWYVSNDVIKKVIDAFEKNDIDIVHGNLIYVNELQNEKFRVLPDLALDNIYRELVINHPTCFVKKDIYKRLGKFDLKYRITADYEFVLRCYANGSRFFYLNKDMVYFRYGGISTKNFHLTLVETCNISILYGTNFFLAKFIFWLKLLKCNLKIVIKKLKLDFLNDFYRKKTSRYEDILNKNDKF